MKGGNHAIDSISAYFGCCWSDPVGDQQLHTDAIYHKENLEFGSGYCSDSLAIECLRTYREPLDDPYREVKSLKIFERN